MDKRILQPLLQHLQRLASMMAQAHPGLLAHAQATARLVEKVIPYLPHGGYASPAVLLVGTFLHDVGKAMWPPELFTKYPLEPADWSLIHAHPVTGANLVREEWPDAPGEVVRIVMEHHERPGGGGYPHGAEPGFPALAVAACEVVDAMTHDQG